MIISGFAGAVFFCVAGLILAAKKKNIGDKKIPEKQEN